MDFLKETSIMAIYLSVTTFFVILPSMNQEDELTDNELIASYLGGNEDVFALLVKRHLSSVYYYVLRMLGSRDDAEDTTQETFVKVWHKLKQFNTQSQLRPWILRIARNTTIDFLRKKRPLLFSSFAHADGSDVFAETLIDGSLLPDEEYIKNESIELLESAIQKLTPAQQEVLQLYYYEDLTFKEIAEILDAPLHTVKSRHLRAIRELRKTEGF